MGRNLKPETGNRGLETGDGGRGTGEDARLATPDARGLRDRESGVDGSGVLGLETGNGKDGE